MSRIDKLVAEHCPRGVAFRALGLLGKRNKGTPITASKMRALALVPGPIRVFAGGQTTADVAEDAVPSKDVVRVPSIIVKSRGHIGFAYYDKPFTHKNELWSYSIDHPEVDQKFVFYYLLTRVSKLQEIARATSVKLPQLGVKDTDTLPIPVPPLEVQREIVRILDTFSKMEAELEAELEARKQQYEHYSWEKLEGSKLMKSSPKATVGDLSVLNRGSVISKDYLAANPGPYPVYSSQTANAGIFGYIDSFAFDDTESITWTTDGANAGSVFFHENKKFNITNVCGRIVTSDDRVSLRYLYYQLRHRAKRYVHAGMGNPKLMANHMRAIPIPLPSMDMQNQIVETLDDFDALVNDLSVGLPAELAARRQQYEYYRDKLLAFKQLEPSS